MRQFMRHWAVVLLLIISESLFRSSLATDQNPSKREEGFIITIMGEGVKVISPQKINGIFSVLVENKSLTNLVAKFMIGNKNMTFLSIPSEKSEAVEIENKTSTPVVFVPLSPGFQEVVLEFGKKAYEIPSKE